ncbi:MAG: hypothetical protein ACKO3N_13270 [Verrucomicrobiota bacterium]
MLRLGLILALLAGIGSLVVTFLVTKPKVEELTGNLASTTEQLNSTQQQLADTTKREKAAAAAAEKAQQELATTRTDLETKTREASVQKSRADKLDTDLNKTVKEKNDAQAQLAQWDALGVKPEQVTQLRVDLRKTGEERDALKDERELFLRKVAELSTRLDKYEQPEKKVVLPAGLRGKVKAVGAQQDFVLLDIGADRKVLEGGEMLVRRGDKLVGKVRIVTVESNRSIANLLPEWKQGDVLVAEDDDVLY